jgi:hypothetical protein
MGFHCLLIAIGCVVMPIRNEKSEVFISSGCTCHGVYSASYRSEYQEQKNNILESRVRPVHRADNFTAISKSIVLTMWDL